MFLILKVDFSNNINLMNRENSIIDMKYGRAKSHIS